MFSRPRCLLVLLCASPFALAGCSGDGEDLTLEQGRILAAEVHKDPKRLEKLTPKEREFLAKALAADRAGRED